jgi:hypothetical protein
MHGAYITNDNFGHEGNSFDKSASRPSAISGVGTGFFSKVSEKSISTSKKLEASRNASVYTNNGTNLPIGKPPKSGNTNF